MLSRRAALMREFCSLLFGLFQQLYNVLFDVGILQDFLRRRTRIGVLAEHGFDNGRERFTVFLGRLRHLYHACRFSREHETSETTHLTSNDFQDERIHVFRIERMFQCGHFEDAAAKCPNIRLRKITFNVLCWQPTSLTFCPYGLFEKISGLM